MSETIAGVYNPFIIFNGSKAAIKQNVKFKQKRNQLDTL